MTIVVKPVLLTLAQALRYVRYSPMEIGVLTKLHGFPLPTHEFGAIAPIYDRDELEEWRSGRIARLNSTPF